MQKKQLTLPLLLAALPLSLWANDAEDTVDLGEVVVIAAKPTKPIQFYLNPKSAIQPIPATDGAGLLKTIPNMSVIRKGGSSGDPLFRGLGGSRLSITADDQFIYGGCAGRMDPPTAYIFPASYDNVVVTKGPQTVTRGPGVVAGSIEFVRDPKRFTEPTATGNFSVLLGEPNRKDWMADVTLGNQYGSIRLNGNYNKAGDYKNGAGQRIHSQYKRHNGNVSVALTPTDDTWIEASYEQSRGQAAYADRGMDGSQFDRDAWSIKAKQKNINDWLSEVSFSYGHSYVDHVMDNYSLRDVPVMMGKPMYRVMNPDRKNDTMKITASLDLGNTQTKVGVDWSKDRHGMRPMGMANSRAEVERYQDKPFTWDQKFSQIGFFAENQWYIDDDKKFISGIRHDVIDAKYNQAVGTGVNVAIHTPNLLTQKYRLNAGFLRYEQRLENWTAFAGLGMAERSPDYWERNRGIGGASLKKERNNEIDVGVLYQDDTLKGSMTIFVSHMDNYILLSNLNGVSKATNIDAKRYGFEGDIAWQFMPNWTLGTSIAYTHGKNSTENRPLAQIAPLESKTYLNWDNSRYSAGVLMRAVAKQNRFAIGQGNLAGTDTGASSGFTVFSAHAGWKINKNIQLLAGVDNIFNKTYTEFANKSNSGIFGGLPITKRVDEPGRQAWLRLEGSF